MSVLGSATGCSGLTSAVGIGVFAASAVTDPGASSTEALTARGLQGQYQAGLMVRPIDILINVQRAFS